MRTSGKPPESDPLTGVLVRTGNSNHPLDLPCPHPARNGSHELYANLTKEYCRACGAERYLTPTYPLEG